MEFLSIIFTLLIVFFISDFLDSSVIEIDENLNKGFFYFIFWGIVSIDSMAKIVGASSRDILAYKTSGILEELIQLPKGQLILIVGSNCYPVFISFVRIIISLLVASILSDQLLVNLSDIFFLIINILFLFTSFIIIGLIAASYTLFFFKVGPVPILFLSFSIFFGSAYFPVDFLPYSMQVLSNLTTLTPALENFRMITSDNFDLTIFITNLGKIIFISSVFVVISIFSLKTSLTHAKKNGTYLHY